jgi:hypothetical protein
VNLRTVVGRFLTGSALALSAVLALGGTVLADSESGQVGHYDFNDTQDHEGGVCVYAGSNPYRLVQVVFKAPRVWWPDTNSDSNTQHGKVGFQGIVRESLGGAYGPYDLVKKSDIMKATAYEDHPDYDLSDKAPLTKITMSINPSNYSSHPNAYIHLRSKVFWYRSDGSVRGMASHDVFYYKWQNVPGNPAATTACPVRFSLV